MRPHVREDVARGLHIGLAILLGGLWLLTLLRWTHQDYHDPLLIAASTAAPVLLMPAYVIAGIAALLRRRALTAASLLLVLVQIHVSAPLLIGGRGLTAAEKAPAATRLRVMALNVQYDHDTGAAVTRQVEQAKPDIVVLTELSDLTLAHLDLSSYPYSSVFPKGHRADGAGIYSRFPLRDMEIWNVNGSRLLRGWVDLPDGTSVRIYQIHTKSPTDRSSIPVWRKQFPTLKAAIAAETGPLIVAGDFNASRSDAPFATLLGGPRGMADAADGRGLLPTWPSSKPLLPPVLRLDHVLVSREIGVRAVHVLSPTGSDHRAVLADLAIAPRA